MAQVSAQQIHGDEGMAGEQIRRREHYKLTNSAAEVTYTYRARGEALAGADAITGLGIITAWRVTGQTTQAAIKVVPVADVTGKGYKSIAITFPANETVDVFVEGY